MTKVKTILKEFCSAKDILAINRLGLLNKGEERESQPIPWRHRLNRGERQELVRSEMRMNIHRPSSQLSVRDKSRAVGTALSPQLSKMGEHLLHTHTKAGHSALDGSLDKLTSEQRRIESRLHHSRRTFLQQSKCLNREPIILVERPPSPNVRTRAAFMNRYGVDPELISIPSYQRPLLARARTPSTITTIDSFAMETRRKKNVWEEAMDDKAEVKFKCTAKPSAKLNTHEIKQLKIGHSIHKPNQDAIEEAAKKAAARRQHTPLIGDPLDNPRSSFDSDDEDASAIFLTELSKKQNFKAGRGQVIRAVTSSKSTEKNSKTQSKYPFPPSVPHGLHNKKKIKSASDQHVSASADYDFGEANHYERRSSATKKSCGKNSSQTRKSSGRSSSRGKGKKAEFLSVLLEESND